MGLYFSRNRKITLGILATLTAVIAVRRRQSRKSKSKSSKKRKKTSNQRIWDILWPKKITDKGSFELISLASLNLFALWSVIRTTRGVTYVDGLLFSKDRSIWRKGLFFLGLASIETMVLEETRKYFRKRLAVDFREKLISAVHDKYFSKASYFHVESDVNDADARIVEDVKTIADGYAEYTSQLTSVAIRGTFYLSMVTYEFGVLYAMTPFAYVVISGIAIGKLCKTKWNLFGQLSAARAAYGEQHSRLLYNSEAIASLNGNPTESKLLDARTKDMLLAQKKVHVELNKLKVYSSFFLRYMLGHLVGLFVIGPGVFTPKDAIGDFVAISQTRADVGYQFMLIIQIMTSAFQLKGCQDAYKKTRGNSKRVVELLDALENINNPTTETIETTLTETATVTTTTTDTNEKKDDEGDEEKATYSEIEAQGICFRNVNVNTPKGDPLVHNLSFELLPNGDSLLLTGHNGVGKSSVFRCLAKLWKVNNKKATILRPKDVFYIPQKPYNVLGTLSDQMNYPDLSKTSTKASMISALDKVGLGYLANRNNAFVNVVDWDKELSLGEQQRLAIARLVYNNPKFAVLDECTSGVTRDMEKWLYTLLHKLEISYVTISHRPVLRAVHQRMLFLEGGEHKTYQYTVLNDRKEITKYMNELKGNSIQEEVLSLSGNVDLQDTAAVAAAATTTHSSFSSIVSRFVRLLQLGLPSSAKSTTLKLLGCVTIKLGVSVLTLAKVGGLFSALFNRDKIYFYKLAGYGALLPFVSMFVDIKMSKLETDLQRDLISGLTNNLTSRYMKTNGFYTLPTFTRTNQQGVTLPPMVDPNARIVEDVRSLAESVTDIALKMIYPIMEIVVLGRNLMQVDNRASKIYIYLFGATIFMRLISPNFRSLTSLQSATEARLKSWYSRVRIHSESIAFFGGGSSERKGAENITTELKELSLTRAWQEYIHGVIQSLFVKRIPDLAANDLRFEYSLTQQENNPDGVFDPGEISRGQHIIWETNNSVLRNVASIVDVFEKCANLAGIVERLAELDERLTIEEELLMNGTNKPIALSMEESKNQPSSIQFSSLNIITPNNITLAKNININIHAGKNKSNVGLNARRLMVTGPNASGKTAFFRILAGLWPCPTNSSITTCGKIQFVAQRPYMVTGTLLNQVLYPQSINAPSELVETESQRSERKQIETEAFELLKVAGIEYLVERWQEKGGWYAIAKWEKTLSLGEQQRLCMARMLHKQPDIAVLDECTDAVSIDVERRLYAAAIERGLTCVTISKRLALEEFHEIELRLGENNEDGYRLLNV